MDFSSIRLQNVPVRMHYREKQHKFLKIGFLNPLLYNTLIRNVTQMFKNPIKPHIKQIGFARQPISNQ